MEYAETVARLGRQNLRTGVQTQHGIPSRERLKSIIQSYVGAPGLRKKFAQQNRKQENDRLFQRDKSVDMSDAPADALLRLGRTLIAKKEVFTKEEAALFIKGDLQLGRMGLVQLAGVDDKALSSAALILLDELLLDDDIEHPSRDAFTEAFVSVGFTGLSKELCLDTHILNEDTRHAALRVALAVGAGHEDNLPLLFRNQRAALDLYLRWMKDMNEDTVNEDDDESVNTGSAIDIEEDKQSLPRPQQSPTGDVGPKLWEEIAQSIEEDGDFADFDNGHGARLRAMMRFSDSASQVSDEGDSMAVSWARYDATVAEDTDPLRIRNKPGSSFSQRNFPQQAIANPEAVLERLYLDASRADLARGFAHLDRDLMSRDAGQQKLVHDRLIDLVRVRQTVDGLGVSTQQGSGLCGKASQSLRAAKSVSDMSLASLLSREDQISQTKRALEIVTERPSNSFVLNFAITLDDLVGRMKWEEAVELVKRYLEERKDLRTMDEAKLPRLFRKARMANDTSITAFVRSIDCLLYTSPSPRDS